jgi:hypothetical protein
MGDEPKLALIESDVPKAIINKMKTKLKLRRTHCWRLRCAFADICDEFKPWQKYKKILYSTFFFAINVPNHGRCSLLGWFVYFVDSVAAVQCWHGRHCGSNDYKAGACVIAGTCLVKVGCRRGLRALFCPLLGGKSFGSTIHNTNRIPYLFQGGTNN